MDGGMEGLLAMGMEGWRDGGMERSVKFSDGAASRSPHEMPPALLTLPADSNPARLDQRRQLPDVHPVVDGLGFRRHPVHRCIPHHGFEPALPLEGRFPERGFMRASRVRARLSYVPRHDLSDMTQAL